MKTTRAKQARLQVAYFVQRDQFGIIAKHSPKPKASLWMWRFRCSSRRNFLNTLMWGLNNEDGNGNARKPKSDWLNEVK